jgi:hypothetical protein
LSAGTVVGWPGAVGLGTTTAEEDPSAPITIVVDAPCGPDVAEAVRPDFELLLHARSTSATATVTANVRLLTCAILAWWDSSCPYPPDPSRTESSFRNRRAAMTFMS